MLYDPDNNIVKLCSEGIALEGTGKPEEAYLLFQQAWNESESDFEKCTSAHYLARHQNSVEEKLKWDETALSFALKINDNNIKASYPSLFLNIAKCYEDMGDISNAKKNYQLALSYCDYLAEDGYGSMIRSGISSGIKRVSGH